MILVDTSIWIDHLRVGDPALVRLLGANEVLSHPFVVGELALGNLRQREGVLAALSNLPRAVMATDAEVMSLIDRHTLAGRGTGYVDAHLLAAAKLTPGAAFWTRDKRLQIVAIQLDVAFTA